MAQQSADLPRRTAPHEERRCPRIEAAMVSIARHGLCGTIAATVAETPGPWAGIVSLHCGGTDNLSRAPPERLAPEHRARWADAVAAAGLAAARRLRALREAHFDLAICTPAKIAPWFASLGEARHREIFRRIGGAFDRKPTAVVEDCCRGLVAEGGYAWVDAAACHRSIESFADGLCRDRLSCPDPVSLGDATDRMRDLLNALFVEHFAPAAATTGSGA
jgi:hypothetical protein